ncbi:hypothetical protein ASPBRDRAFT_617882 [Aspergillus brasiliensis CBS 101740]|uniref:Uncharacterized protein n=1 Tax=Aspergillus brasiliensis (strain CBS 101740 / IMI 381727 / IBT 21946) TaxID=767769 RepID=A0A1L9UF81_ASPBC|nr:hypothetical protein ASPBRDRAFT_617882 [Aspergillus brasiliensis CBS 101740]
MLKVRKLSFQDPLSGQTALFSFPLTIREAEQGGGPHQSAIVTEAPTATSLMPTSLVPRNRYQLVFSYVRINNCCVEHTTPHVSDAACCAYSVGSLHPQPIACSLGCYIPECETSPELPFSEVCMPTTRQHARMKKTIQHPQASTQPVDDPCQFCVKDTA